MLFFSFLILIGFRKYLSDECGRNMNTLFIIYLLARKVWGFFVVVLMCLFLRDTIIMPEEKYLSIDFVLFS